ncbi:hypothetical protein NLU13_9061 [Sarocladium strictum]|uniref:Uncharacterized protein n=1 Tax=Sarocladium strictum TaxID=5046 RepID=A0AA39L3U2_SARSR|nr:hypothetical protein NLU13_9061 [Sarocladium strictum]
MIHRRARTPPRDSAARRRLHRNTAFQAKLAQMRIRLSPIVQISTGAVHPAFPKTLLNFWLLTEEQLDSLALFYHQRYPNEFTMSYPCPVEWPATGLTIADKRRKMGRFIGLRGCESPVVIKTEEEIWEEVRRNAAIEEEMRLRGKLGRGFPG